MKFRSRSDYSHGPFYVRTFPMTEPKYTMSVDPDTGKRSVVLAGQSNVYQQKQEALPDTLLYNLIEQYQRTGDSSVFGSSVGGFIDVTAMPRNLMEAENVRLQAEALFKSLSIEERASYGNDIGVFLRNVNDKLKEKIVSSREAAIDSVVSEPVKEVANE